MSGDYYLRVKGLQKPGTLIGIRWKDIENRQTMGMEYTYR